MEAFSMVGGAEYLRRISRTHPQVFCALLGKILPAQTQISGDPANPLQTINRIEYVVIQPPKQLSPQVVNVNASR